MTEKIEYSSNYISYKEAITHFKSEEDLIDALKDGNVLAVGSYYQNVESDFYESRIHINSWCWRNYHKSDDGNLFGGAGEYGNVYATDDPEEYRDVEILVSSIESLAKLKKTNAGRPVKYDWDEFWRAVSLHLFMAALQENDYILPMSLNDWVKNAADDYSYAFKNKKIPSETTLKDKLRPLWHEIEDFV